MTTCTATDVGASRGVVETAVSVATFDPKILGILCNWCSYAGADLAGTTRIHYAPNLRIVRVMCSGRVDPSFILHGLRSGADGVLIAGCHPGDCHYQAGNTKAMRRFALLKRVLAELRIDPTRVRLEWVSASEGERFARIVNEFTATVAALGPFGAVDGGNGDRFGDRGDKAGGDGRGAPAEEGS